MKLALVGVGGAGRRLVDAIRAVAAEEGRQLCDGNLLTVDISRTGGDECDNVPRERQVTIGDTHPGVADDTDGDPNLAVEVARADDPEIHRALDSITMRELDGVLVVAGLGGGTGSGVGAVLVERLQQLYSEPVYVLGVLPGEDEGGRPALNAARALRSIVPAADSTLLFDNGRWVDGDDDRYTRANRELATRTVALFARSDADQRSIGANTLDSSDIVRTLSPGGVASVGHATSEFDTGGGFLSWLRALLPGGRDDDADDRTDAGKVKSLVGRATNSRLTLPCTVSSAERVLVVLSGPPEELSRRGFESARQWLETETDTVEVLAGDDPRPGSSAITATVLLSNVTEVPRIDSMQRQAVEHERAAGTLRAAEEQD
ncbi:MAG: tubulin/FtsZ family protein [Haloferacaceae archaeon]